MMRHTRRSFVRTTGIAGALLASGTALTGTAAASHDADDSRVQWCEFFETRRGRPADFEVGPLLTDESLVVAAGGGTRCSPTNRVASFDPSSQDEQWSAAIDSAVTRPLAATAGTVVAGTEDRVVGLDAAEGSVRWETPADAVTDAGFAVLDETVYVPLTEEPTDETALVALDAASGTEQWRFGDATGGVAVGHGQVYVDAAADGGEAIAALDPATGDRNWLVTDVDGSVLDAADGLVFTSQFPGWVLGARDATDGTVQWRQDRDRSILGYGVVTDGDTGFIPNGYGTGVRGVDALALDDGALRWQNLLSDFQQEDAGATTDPNGYHTARPVLADDVLYLSYERFVIAVDPADGSVIDHYEGDTDVGGLALGDDAVYLTDASGHLLALDPLA